MIDLIKHLLKEQEEVVKTSNFDKILDKFREGFPNEYKNDNWSTSGNSNPHTGQSGTNTHKGTCSALTINC